MNIPNPIEGAKTIEPERVHLYHTSNHACSQKKVPKGPRFTAGQKQAKNGTRSILWGQHNFLELMFSTNMSPAIEASTLNRPSLDLTRAPRMQCTVQNSSGSLIGPLRLGIRGKCLQNIMSLMSSR